MQEAAENKNGQTKDMMSTHSRYSVGLTYVYPVISRRAGGVSIGINLNTNNACNWQCVYCQVPNLTRGKPEKVDLALLEKELTGFLDEVLHGHFMEEFVPENARQLCDIAFSGNGEPTSTAEFPEVVRLMATLKTRYPEIAELPVRLITNGSFMGKESVQEAVKMLSTIGGEVWFKVDAISKVLQQKTNGVSQTIDAMLNRLTACAKCCPTWLQTCLFSWDKQAPDETQIADYLQFCRQAKEAGIQGIHLYTIARKPMLPEGIHLSALTAQMMDDIAQRIRALDIVVKVSV